MNLKFIHKTRNHTTYFLLIILLISSLSFFNSCSNPNKFYYLKCDTATVYKWLDSVHYDSAHRMGSLILQFYSPDIRHSDNNMEAIIYPLSVNGTYYQTYPDSLKKDRDTSLTGPAVFGNNSITRQQIIDAISDTPGHFVTFTNLVFQPIIDSNFHVRYAIFATNGSGIPKFAKPRPTSDPCPPAQCYQH